MPTSVLVICIIQGILLLFTIGSTLFYFSQSEETVRENTRTQLEIQFEQMGLDGIEITESQIDQTIRLSEYFMAFGIISFSISILLFIGFCHGNRLTWYFYRTLGLVSAIFLTFGLFQLPRFIRVAMKTGDLQLYLGVASTLFSIVFSWAIYFILGTESAREFFSAICPTCRFKKIKPLNLFATKVSCKSCGDEWT